MNKPRLPMTKTLMVSRTSLSRQRVVDLLDLANRVRNDVDKTKRKASQLCVTCHYWPAIAGNAITSQPCMSCNQDQTYGTTCTDALCMSCAQAHSLCKRCGGDISHHVNRKQWPEPTQQ